MTRRAFPRRASSSRPPRASPSTLTCSLPSSAAKNIPIDVTVTKDGETVTDYSEPGTYNAVITCAVAR